MPLKIPPFTPVHLQPEAAEPFSTFVQNTPSALTPLTGAELVPIIQNGASKHVPPNTVGFGPPVRTILTANQNYYVAVGGSDSNSGSITSKWATLQHAMNFIANNLDVAGFTVNVNVGTGSFAGFGYVSCVGGGQVAFLGAGTFGSTVTGGPNDGVFNFGDCIDIEAVSDTGLTVDNLNFSVSTNLAAFEADVFNPSIVFGTSHGNKITFPAGGGASGVIIDAAGAFCTMQAAMPIDATAGGTQNRIWVSDQAAVIINAISSVTVTGTLALSAFSQSCFVTASRGGVFNQDSATVFSGTVTGPRFATFSDGHIISGGGNILGANFFPGNSVGTTDDISSYDFFDGIDSRSGAPTSSILSPQTQALSKDTGQGTATKGIALYVNDSGTVFPLTPLRTTFANLPASPHQGDMASITDGKAANCGDGSCTTFGTTVTAGGGALNLLIWYNGTNWTLMGK